MKTTWTPDAPWFRHRGVWLRLLRVMSDGMYCYEDANHNHWNTTFILP